MIILPLLAGAGLLGLLMAGGKSPEGEITSSGDIVTKPAAKEKAVKDVVKAVKSQDWQKAVASALASGSVKAVEETVKALNRAGKTAEAQALLSAFRELQIVAIERSKKKAAAKPASKPTPKPAAKPKALPPVKKPAVKPTPKPAVKPKALPPVKPTPKPAAKPATKAKTVKKVSPEKKLAADMLAMLMRSKRYTEDQALVERYQKAHGQVADGKYGVNGAKSVWDKHKLVPVNPFYFSSNQATAHQQAADYKRWLLGVAAQLETKGDKKNASLARTRAETVGK